MRKCAGCKSALADGEDACSTCLFKSAVGSFSQDMYRRQELIEKVALAFIARRDDLDAEEIIACVDSIEAITMDDIRAKSEETKS